MVIYVSAGLSHQVSSVDFSTEFDKQVWITMKLRGYDKLILGFVYISPFSGDENNNNFFLN